MRCALLLLVLLALPRAGDAQVISGTLVETESLTPLHGGVVALLDQDSATVAESRTDSVGAFFFTIPRGGSYRLTAAQTGYRTAASPLLTIGSRDTLEVEFSLARDVVMLDPLVVKARSRRITSAARRFYDRAEIRAGGTYITREEIEKAHPLRTTELFRSIPGVQTTPMMGGNHVTVRGGCRPTVFIDGVRVNGYRSIDDLVEPMDLEGVEVYRAAHGAPVEYGGMQAGCAVVLLWTRIE